MVPSIPVNSPVVTSKHLNLKVAVVNYLYKMLNRVFM